MRWDDAKGNSKGRGEHRLEACATGRLRLGFVSGDFRVHPVARFLEPLMAERDRERLEIFCYSDVKTPDRTTARLRRYADSWRDVAAASDAELADIIRRDRIDVLVNLSGHLPLHRLLTFARRPAPVQVSYLEYPNTSGLTAIDYRITDSLHDPPGVTERYHTEKLIRLDPCCWCYRPMGPDEEAPEVTDLPATREGRVTFAVFNRLAKVTPMMVRLWAQVLAAVPRSRILAIVTEGTELDPAVREVFTSGGIDPDRVVLLPRRARAKYLRLYQSADIALDTFPYAGHTTTCDATWMGVPTVSLAGKTHAERTGLSVLSAVGLEDLVAESPEGYVEKAINLATDFSALAALRGNLRERMARSPLRDELGFAARFEAAIRAL